MELVATTSPDLVVLDIRMPPSYTDEGATAARLLKPDLGVLLLSQHIETANAADLVCLAGLRLRPVSRGVPTAKRRISMAATGNGTPTSSSVTPIRPAPAFMTR
jgi:DNA-binding NarL/FixJ family response regulator